MTQAALPPDPRVPRDQLVRRLLTAAGCSEAVTFGFIEAKAVEVFRGTQSSQSTQSQDSSAISADSAFKSRRHREPALRQVRYAPAIASNRAWWTRWRTIGGTAGRDVRLFENRHPVRAPMVKTARRRSRLDRQRLR